MPKSDYVAMVVRRRDSNRAHLRLEQVFVREHSHELIELAKNLANENDSPDSRESLDGTLAVHGYDEIHCRDGSKLTLEFCHEVDFAP
jgi:hypothetical protein